MNNDTTTSIQIPAASPHDVLNGILRDGARQMLGEAIEAEVADYIAAHAHQRDAAGHRHPVHHMGMGVGLGGLAVGGPSGVADPHSAHQRLLCEYAGQVGELPLRPSGPDAVFHQHRNAGGIVSAILQPLEPINEQRRDRRAKFFHRKPPEVLDVCQVPMAGRVTR